MNEAAKEARRAYKKKWNAEHRDRVKQYQEDYWNRKAQEAKEHEEEQAAENA